VKWNWSLALPEAVMSGLFSLSKYSSGVAEFAGSSVAAGRARTSWYQR
jgi:hypothetical protein